MSAQGVDSAAPRRLYGGWRVARGIGVGKLNERETMILLGSFLVVALAVSFAGVRGLLLAPIAAAIVALAIVRVDGVSALDRTTAWARYQGAARRGEHRLVSQVAREWPTSTDLPGVLASTVLLDVEVPGADRAAAVWDRSTGRVALTVLVEATGALLSDRADAERAVAQWGALLAGLSDHPEVEAAMTTLDLRPGSGARVGAALRARIDTKAPPEGRAIIEDLLAIAPQRSTKSERWVTLVFNPSRSHERLEGPREVIGEALRTLSGVNFAASGAAVRRIATSRDIKRIVRTAYEPSIELLGVHDREWDELAWGECGPDGAEEWADSYEHNGHASVSYVLSAAPRQRVGHNVLMSLLRPSKYARRVTLMYRLASIEEAGRMLEIQQTAAGVRREARRRSRRDPSARDIADDALAQRAAAQEAAGAGLMTFSAIVTTTVNDPEDLPSARAEVLRSAGQSKLKLRLGRHAQASLFAAGLPCGIYPPSVARAKRRRAGAALGLPGATAPAQQRPGRGARDAAIAPTMSPAVAVPDAGDPEAPIQRPGQPHPGQAPSPHPSEGAGGGEQR